MCFHFSLERLVVESQGFGGPPAVPSSRFQRAENYLFFQGIHPLSETGAGSKNGLRGCLSVDRAV